LGYAKCSDFVREQLGLTLGFWFDLVHAGTLLTQPGFRAALRTRQLEFSALVLLGRRFSPRDALAWCSPARQSTLSDLRAALPRAFTSPEVDSTDSDELVQLRLRLPAAVADFLHESHELCSALVGRELSQADALHYLLAEASSEVQASVDTAHVIPAQLRPHRERPNPNIRQPRRATGSLRQSTSRHRLAVRLTKRPLALIRQEHALQLAADDALRQAWR
jgi:hypothetical protein